LVGTLGIGPALVYYGDSGTLRAAANTALAFSVALALALAITLNLFASSLAGLFSEGFSQADVTAVIRLMSVVVALLTIASVPQALIERTLNFRDRAIPDLVALLFYALASVAFLLLGFGIWSLLIARVLQSAVVLSLYWLKSPIAPRLRAELDLSLLRKLLSYGKFFAVASWVVFLTGNLDTLFVGKWAGAQALGAYALAYAVANAVPTFISATLGRVLFPAYVALRTDVVRLSGAVNQGLYAASLALFPTSVILFLLGPWFVLQVFGEQWVSTESLLRALVLYGLARGVGSILADVLAAVGKPDRLLVAQLLALLIPLAILIASPRNGAVAIATAFTTGQVASVGYAVLQVRKRVRLAIWSTLRGLLVGTTILAIVVVVVDEHSGPWSAAIAATVTLPLILTATDEQFRRGAQHAALCLKRFPLRS
jgi:O-antigen/teichoic acid export membrane protein